MTGQEFLNKIEALENCITAFNASLDINDGSRLSLTREQETKIRDWLIEYKKMLLEKEIG